MKTKKYKGRYKIIRLDPKAYTILDQEHKMITFPLFELRLEAERFRAGLHSLTVEEYREWTQCGRRRGRQ